MMKSLPASAGDLRDAALVPGWIFSGVGNGNLLQYFCLDNPMDRRAWCAIVHWAAKRGGFD